MEACTCYAIFLSTLIFLYEHVFHFSAWFRMTTQHHGGGVLRVGVRGWGVGGAVSEPKVSCWFVLCVCVCVSVYVRALSLSLVASSCWVGGGGGGGGLPVAFSPSCCPTALQ